MSDSAATIAARVRAGDATASEVVAAALLRGARAQRRFNAAAMFLETQATEAARALDQVPRRGLPLAGVPISVKESVDVAGTPSSGGVVALAERPRAGDARLVAALRSAGALIVAKGNLAQLMWFAETDNPVYGRTSNPWSLEHSPGGSSGGDAALVAAGVVPVAIGTDIGGSVRLPAHCCGVPALKPTSGRLPVGGSLEDRLFAGLPAIRNAPGIFGTTVEDIALVLRVLDQATGRGAHPAAPASPAGLRVGVFADNGIAAVSPPLRRAVELAAQAAERAGAKLVEFAPPDAREALELFDAVFAADGGAALERCLAGGPAHPRVAEAIESARPRALGADGAADLERRIARYRTRFSRALDGLGIDAVLCPPYAGPAVRHGESGGLVTGQSYCSLWNLLGYPAGVAPVTAEHGGEEPFHGSALPVGVQVAARPWREDHVLGLMAAIAPGQVPAARP